MKKACAAAVRASKTAAQGADVYSGAALASLAEVLRSQFGCCAEMSAYQLRDRGATSDMAHPGYVVVSTGSAKVFVPFYLVDMIALGDRFADLLQLGESIRVSGGSVYCLSGSSCQIGAVPHVSDLDFCEYVPKLDAASIARLTLSASQASLPALLRVALGNGQTWAHPWKADLLATPRHDEHLLATLEGAAFRQCVYLTDLPGLGPLEATNLLLKLNYANPEASAAAGASFAYQEIAVSATDWAPRNLADPVRLGDYIRFLAESADTFLASSHEKPRGFIKALRRLLSLARLAFDGGAATRLAKVLVERGAPLASLHDSCELYATLLRDDREFLNVHGDELTTRIQTLRAQLVLPGAAVWADSDQAALVSFVNDEFLVAHQCAVALRAALEIAP